MVGLSLLERNGITIATDINSSYDFVVSIASGSYRYDEILNWLKNNTSKI